MKNYKIALLYKLRNAMLMDYLPLKLISTFYHYFVIFTNTYCFFGYGYPSFTLAGPCCIHPSLIEPGTTSISTFDLSLGEWAMRLGILFFGLLHFHIITAMIMTNSPPATEPAMM